MREDKEMLDCWENRPLTFKMFMRASKHCKKSPIRFWVVMMEIIFVTMAYYATLPSAIINEWCQKYE